MGIAGSERLRGKRALVTAAAQGIGAAIARVFAEAGAHTIATDINEAKLAGLATRPGITAQSLDVTNRGAVQAVAERVGSVDVLVNCAGIVHHGDVLSCRDEEWAFAFELNVTAMYRTIQAFLPGMLECGKGSIINIGSVASSVKGVKDRCAYGASKAAVIGLTKSVAADYVTRGIRCNTICPGTVQSPSLDERIAAQGGTAAVRDAFVARQPMGRLGTADEIAAMALYLASDESAFTTGATMVVDGGMTI